MSCPAALPRFILVTVFAMRLDAAGPAGNPFSPALPNATITALTTDAVGNTYVTGTISAPGLPTTPDAFQPNYHAALCAAVSPQFGPYPCRDSFVVRYDASGKLVYATYLGGNGNDDASAIAVDAEGNAYVTGFTGSTDFPTTPNVLANAGGPSGFVAKLDPAGTTLLYSTYIPGATTAPAAIAVDGAERAYIAGSTADPGFFTTPGAFQHAFAGGLRDGFVLKLSSTAGEILYATYLGGGGTDNITALGLDSSGNAYVTGNTDSRDFPITPGAVDTMPANKMTGSLFVAKLNSDGSALIYSARPTGSYADQPAAIAVDPVGRAYVTGGTSSPDFPSTSGALQSAHGNSFAAFVLALSAGGKSLVYSTYLGGATAGSNGLAIEVNQGGEAYIAGWTLDFDFPTTADAPERCNPLGAAETRTASWVYQGFLSKLARDGSALLFSSYIDGAVAAMSIGADGDAVLAGNAYNPATAAVTAAVRAVTPAPAPAIGVDCVASSATGMSGIVAPGELVTIYGSGLGPAQGASAQFVNGRVGTELGGTRVLFDGTPAPVLYTQADRVQAVVPFELAGRTTAVQVQYGGQATSPAPLVVQDSVPGIFHLGPTNLAAVLNEDGTLNSPDNPAPRGSVVSLFATGAGWMDPLPGDGAIGAAPLPRISAPVTVDFYGWRGDVLYAGAAPEFVAGTVQVNARIPPDMLSFGPYTDLNLIVGGPGRLLWQVHDCNPINRAAESALRVRYARSGDPMRISRRQAVTICAAPLVAQTRPRVAITMDDVRWQIIPEKRRPEAEERLLEHLGKTRASLFAIGECVDNEHGSRILKEWSAAGHWIGNHTYSHHALLAKVDPAGFEQDILRNDAVLRKFAGFRKWFRFPALKEGPTRELRDRFRGFLAQHGYRNGAVTIDASDWYYNQRLLSRMETDPGFDLTLYREPYLNHIRDRAEFYDQLSREVLGRSVSHTLLIHYNLLNALFLGDLLGMFRGKGWGVIGADEAFADPVFERQPDTVPAGESLVWALAKETGRFEKRLRYPGEDDVYEKPVLDRLHI